jgi:hypothetical protein
MLSVLAHGRRLKALDIAALQPQVAGGRYRDAGVVGDMRADGNLAPDLGLVGDSFGFGRELLVPALAALVPFPA